MMIWLILAHVYNSLGNKEGFVIFKPIILMPARLNLQNVCNSLGKMTVLIKTMKIHYVLNGIDENP